jgi:hypothetical protein
MMRPAIFSALALAGALLLPVSAGGQYEAIPQTVLNAQIAVMSEAQLDSACAARALPLAGAAIFGGLRDALARARGVDAVPLDPARATMREVTMTGAWYLVLLMLGLVMLVFAGDRLRQVTETVERDTAGALVTGLIAGVASLPLLVAAVVVLALTVIGILLIPFAVVAIVLVYAGLTVLGFLAVSSVLGRAVLGDRKARMTERAASLSGMITGLTLIFAVWLAAAAFTWSPATGLVLRSMALGLTAVAITAGVGAVIRSFRPSARAQQLTAPLVDDLSWQTPTPVGGVVAMRRPAGQ